jgi:hypothetical protein
LFSQHSLDHLKHPIQNIKHVRVTETHDAKALLAQPGSAPSVPPFIMLPAVSLDPNRASRQQKSATYGPSVH